MNILVCGDPHFKKDNLPIMELMVNDFIGLIEERKPDLCVVLGDTLHDHANITVRPLCMAIDFFEQIAKLCQLVVLIGNHDRENNSDFCTDIHPFNGLKSNPRIKIVDTTYWDQENNFIFVPYVPNGKFNQALSLVDYDPTIKPTKDSKVPTLIFSHQEFKGCQLSVNKYSETGDTWDKNLPQIVSGHIHEYQILPHVIYVGTPTSTNYGESNDKKVMFLHLDPAEDSEESNKGPWSFDPGTWIKRVQLKSFCSRTTLVFNQREIKSGACFKKIPKNSITASEMTKGQVGTLVRVIIEVKVDHEKALKESINYKSLLKQVDQVKIKYDRSEDHDQTVVGKVKKIIDNDISKQGQIPSLIEVAGKLLADDPIAQKIYYEEIIN